MAFSKSLDKHKVARTNWYTFDTLNIGHPESPRFEVCFAGKGTPGFRADEIRSVIAARGNGGDKISERRLEESLTDKAKRYARYCVKSWQNMCEDEAPGVLAPCTYEKVSEFLVWLVEFREQLFLGFARYVEDEEHFTAPDEAPAGGGVALGKS